MILHRTTSCIRARRVPIYGTQWWNNIITDWDDNIRVHLRQAEAAAPPLPLPCGETALIDGSFRVIATQQHGIYKPMFMYLPTLRILNKMASGEMEKGKVGEKWSISFQWGANDVRGQKESFQNLLLSAPSSIVVILKERAVTVPSCVVDITIPLASRSACNNCFQTWEREGTRE